MKPLARKLSKLLLCLLAILLAPCVAGRLQAVAAEGAIPAAENPASDNPALKYLPDDYWAVVGLDVKTLMQLLSSDAVKNNPQFATVQQGLATIKLMTGIDLENDVESIVLFAAGDPDGMPKALSALSGSFDNQQIEAQLKGSILAQGFKSSKYKSKTLYIGPSFGYYFPADSTLVAGDPDLLRATIDKLDATPAPDLPESLENLLERTSDDSIVWAAVKAAPLLKSDRAADFRDGNPEISAELAKIDTASLSFGLEPGGLLIHTLAYATATDKSKSLYQFLDKRRSSLLFQEGSNVVFCSFLILAELTNDGPFTRGSLRLTLPALTELWNTKVIVKQP